VTAHTHKKKRKISQKPADDNADMDVDENENETEATRLDRLEDERLRVALTAASQKQNQSDKNPKKRQLEIEDDSEQEIEKQNEKEQEKSSPIKRINEVTKEEIKEVRDIVQELAQSTGAPEEAVWYALITTSGNVEQAALWLKPAQVTITTFDYREDENLSKYINSKGAAAVTNRTKWLKGM